jgi:hypothetical protein
MEKPRILLGSSGKQAKLVQALTRGLGFYYWRGERPLDPDAPQLEGVGEIRLESADRAAAYFTTRADGSLKVNTRTVGVYLRAEPSDLDTLDGPDNRKRVKLIADRLKHLKSIKQA